MDCRSAQRLLDLHAGKDLALDEAQALDRHLEGCRKCREVFAGCCRTRDLLAGLSFRSMAREMPQADQEEFWADMTDDIMERIEREKVVARWGGGAWFLSGFAAAASLMAVLWLGFGRTGPASPGGPGAAPKVDGRPLELVTGPIGGSSGRAELVPKLTIPVHLQKEGWPLNLEQLLEKMQRGENVPVGVRKADF